MKQKRITALFTAVAALAAALPLPPMNVSAAEENKSENELPASFDLREHGLVSSVKKQDPYGTCWAHAAMASLESLMIADDPTVDLSEWHLSHFMFIGESGMLGSTDYDYLQNGGSTEDAYALLMNQVGPMREADYPYDSGTPDATKSIKEMQKEACLEVTAWHKSDDPDIIKKTLYNGCAPTFSVLHSYLKTSCYNSYYGTLYYPEELADQIDAEFPPHTQRQGHAMTLVGWDDNYPAENFNYTPESDGAWLLKNSWGPEWGDAGYVWISYEDDAIGNISWFDVQPASTHDQCFSHDNLGPTGTLSMKMNNQDTEAYYANVFVPEEDCCLTDLMLYCTDPDDTLEVTVYTGLNDRNDPTSGTPSPVSEYHLPYEGYQYVPLEQNVSVQAGEPFSVCVKASGKAGAHIPCELGMETTKILKNREGYLFGNFIGMDSASMSIEQQKKYFHEHESFISTNGTAWTDVADDKVVNMSNYELIMGNVSVRVCGVDAGRVQFSEENSELPLDQKIALSNAEGAEIYYAINGGEYRLYSEPIPFTENMIISAYADTGSKTVWTKKYTQRKAALSSLLISDDVSCRYADLTKDNYTIELHENAFLQPISTGSITINGEPWTSGHKYYIESEDAPASLKICVEQKGLLPQEYHVKVIVHSLNSLPSGIYYDAHTKTACEFRNGTGIEKHLDNGTTETFTYRIIDPHNLELTYADRTENFFCETMFNSLNGSLNGYFRMYSQNGTYHQYTFLNRMSFAVYPAYTDAQIQTYTLKAFRNYSGKEVTSVEMSETNESVIILDFYNEGKKIDTMFCDHFGLMYTSNMKPCYYSLPQYRRCDFNGDKVISIADAILMHRIVGEDFPETMPSQTALEAADLDADGMLTISDTVLFLDTLGRMTNNRA